MILLFATDYLHYDLQLRRVGQYTSNTQEKNLPYNGSLIHTQTDRHTHTYIHVYNLMLNAQNNMIINVIVFLVICFCPNTST